MWRNLVAAWWHSLPLLNNAGPVTRHFVFVRETVRTARTDWTHWCGYVLHSSYISGYSTVIWTTKFSFCIAHDHTEQEWSQLAKPKEIKLHLFLKKVNDSVSRLLQRIQQQPNTFKYRQPVLDHRQVVALSTELGACVYELDMQGMENQSIMHLVRKDVSMATGKLNLNSCYI